MKTTTVCQIKILKGIKTNTHAPLLVIQHLSTAELSLSNTIQNLSTAELSLFTRQMRTSSTSQAWILSTNTLSLDYNFPSLGVGINYSEKENNNNLYKFLDINQVKALRIMKLFKTFIYLSALLA